VTRRNPLQICVALWLAVVLPLAVYAQPVVGGRLLQVGWLNPVGTQGPQSQHEEDETHSHAKLAVTKAVQRVEGRFSFVRYWEEPDASEGCPEPQHARSWRLRRTFPLPSGTCLSGALSRRGPPTA